MRQKIKHGFIFFLLFPLFAGAQLEADNWIFGFHGSYVNFNKATQPTMVNYPATGWQPALGASSYSDKNGQLLFYADGLALLNRDFNNSPSTDPGIVTNGIRGQYLYGALGNFSQKILAVPYPEHDSLFILFSIYYQYANNFKPELLYSIVNMNMDSGRGGVDNVKRNIPLFGPLWGDTNVLFKLTAILHCNKKDIWVVGHLANSDKYFSLLVTANGISNNPVFSSGNFIVSPVGSGIPDHPYLDGCVKVSPLGNKIAAAYRGYDYIELADFNTQTGMVSGVKKIVAAPPQADTVYVQNSSNAYGPLGVEFSPTGNRLYITSNYDVRQPAGIHFTSFIYQFNTLLATETQIQNSKYFIDSMFEFLGGAIQLANNGKMYVNVGDNLCEIANPENLGAACNYTRFTVMTGGGSPTLGLPIFLQSYLRYPIIATGNCQFQNISFNIQNPVGVSAVNWDFGDPASGTNNTSASLAPTHIYTTQGVYKVKAVLQNANGCGADTIVKIINAGPFKVFLGNDTTICQGDTLQLHMKIPYASNLWSSNSVDTAIKVTQPGKYWVKVNLGECSASDTIDITFRNLPQFSLGNDTVICNNSSVKLSPNITYANISYLWNTNATAATITTSLAGDYWLNVTDNIGCKFRDTIKVSYKTLPNFTLGRDTAICQNDTMLLNATVSSATSYVWSTGAVTPSIKAYTQDIYWCDVNKEGCIYRDTLILTVKPLPIVSLGNDITLCEDQTLLLDATNTNATYQWQDNTANPTYLVTAAGTYFIAVTKAGCIAKDTITIAYNLKPKFTLGTDSRLCLGSTLTLDPKITGVSYLWQDGSATPTYKVMQPGLYSLTATNTCGATTDYINIGDGVCSLYVPNSFTPNGDTKNDLFKAGHGDNITEFELQVFNRYGQIIFATKDKNQGWDGIYKGTAQPYGSYVWVIQYKTAVNNNWEKLQGTVLLIR